MPRLTTLAALAVAATLAVGTRECGVAASFHYLQTGFEAAELETGDLPQQIDFDPISFLVRVQYSFGHRTR